MTPDQSAATVFRPFKAVFSVEGRGPVALLDLAPWMVAAPGAELALLREQGGISGEPALRLALILEQLGNTYAEGLVASLEKGATLALTFDPAAFDAWVPHHRPNFLPALRIEEANLAYQPDEDGLHVIIAADHPRWEAVADGAAWFREAEAGVIASWAADAFCGGEVSEIFLRALEARGDRGTCAVLDALGTRGGGPDAPTRCIATLSEAQVLDWLQVHRPDAYQASLEAYRDVQGCVPVPGHEDAPKEELELALV